MSPAEVRTLTDNQIVEMLVSLRPSNECVAWLASLIADPVKVAGVSELSRRYVANVHGRSSLPRAKSAGSVQIDGAKFKRFFWMRRIPLREVGPMVGRSEGYGSVIAFRGRISYWMADAISNELGIHVEAFISQVGSEEELERLAVCV